jgi:hypothetical protein
MASSTGHSVKACVHSCQTRLGCFINTPLALLSWPSVSSRLLRSHQDIAVLFLGRPLGCHQVWDFTSFGALSPFTVKFSLKSQDHAVHWYLDFGSFLRVAKDSGACLF